MKKLSNLESTFSKSDTNWKNKPIILTETLRMVIYLSKNFLQTQSFFIVWNQDQRKWSCLTSKSLTKLNLYRGSKSYIKLHISSVTLCDLSLSNTLIPTYWQQEKPWVAVYLQTPINYSNDTSKLLLTLQLRYKPFSILQKIIKNK